MQRAIPATYAVMSSDILSRGLLTAMIPILLDVLSVQLETFKMTIRATITVTTQHVIDLTVTTIGYSNVIVNASSTRVSMAEQ
jgi:hypothetical protein